MELTRIALNRPVFILMIVLGACLSGYLALKSTRTELNPEVNFGALTVATVYPGAGAEEITEQVTKKIEDSISGIGGLREIFSISQEGMSIVSLNFDIGTNMDNALNDTRAKLDTVIPELPKNIIKPVLNKLDTSSEPVLNLALNSTTLSTSDLREFADDKLKDLLTRIPGVASVYISGGDEREIQVRLSTNKLNAYGISAMDVLSAIQSNNLNMPVGFIDTGEREQSIRIKGEPESLNDIKNIYIFKRDNTSVPPSIVKYKLSDIADVTVGTKDKREITRLNGKESVVVTVQKSREGNAIEISKAIDKLQSKIQKNDGITLVKTLDTSKQVSESIEDLNFALFFGILLVVVIIYMFLHNFRGMLIVAATIPITLLASFIAIKWLGFTINNMSMLALTLAIGVLVDDAIVVLENIYRHLKMGEDPVTAAIKGRSEIGLAAIAITLADVVVFLPVGTMDGVVGQFFRPLGIVFSVVVILSLLVSFTVTPLLASLLYKKGEDLEKPTGKFALWFESKFLALETAYRNTLIKALGNRWNVFIGGFTILGCVITLMIGGFSTDLQSAIMSGLKPCIFMIAVSGIIAFINFRNSTPFTTYLVNGAKFGSWFVIAALIGFGYGQWKGEAVFKFSFFPPNDSGKVSVSIELPQGASLKETEKFANSIEKIVEKHPDVKNVITSVGSGGNNRFGLSSYSTNIANVQALLKPKAALVDKLGLGHIPKADLRYNSDISVAAELTESVGKRAGADVKVSAADMFGIGTPIQLSFQSNNRDLLQKVSQTIYDRLNSGAVEGLVNTTTSYKLGKNELVATPKLAEMANLGASTAQVAQVMRLLYEGNDDSKYRFNGKEYDIRTMLDRSEKNDEETLNRIPVFFDKNRAIYFNNLFNFQMKSSVDKISRRDLMEEIQIKANLLPGFAAGSVQSGINNLLQNENLIPEGVTYKPLGQAELQQKESGFLMSALLTGFLLVYMLLASLYNNLLYPFIIQLSQPQALIGALLALILTDKTLNLVGFIGIIALVGLVGKNAILLVDYTNTLRERGYTKYEALLEAGPTRLRPILMTTLAVVLGMLPVALAIGRGSEFRETIGIVIIGGITLSTILTLIVIPCSYLIFDDLSERIMDRIKKKEGGSD